MIILPATFLQANLLAQLDVSRSFSAHWTLEQWMAELAQPAARIWYAAEGGKVIGFIALRGAAGQYELLNLAIAADQCRQGKGRLLLAHAINELKKGGVEEITLEVSSANLPAQALYRQAGFVVVGVRKNFYKDGSDGLIMRKNL